VRLAIEIDPAVGRWRVAIAREGSETWILTDEPRAHETPEDIAGRGGIMDFLNDVRSASFPVVDGADTLLPFSRKDRR
jgi:hypothetical protein